MQVKLDIPLTLSEIAEAVGSHFSLPDQTVEYISTDTRGMTAGALFFSLSGGEKYVPEAMEKGHAVGITNSTIQVSDTENALLSLASYYIRKLKMLKYVVAITGSVGKTTVKDFTAAILAKKFHVHKTEGNHNNAIGLSLSVLAAPRDTEILVLECGMNHKGEISRLSAAIHPDIAVITNVGTSHIGNLGSREAIAEAKLEITHGMKYTAKLIIPSDEPLLLSDRQTVLRVGKNGDIKPRIRSVTANETAYSILKDNESIAGSLPFGDKHLVGNLAFAIAVASSVGIPLDCIASALTHSENFMPRWRRIELSDFTVIDDSYNASLESYRAAFAVLSKHCGPKSAVIGDVLEAGALSDKIHEAIGKEAASAGINKIYPFGEFADKVVGGAVDAGFDVSMIFPNKDRSAHEKTAREILKNVKPDELILIKGSRALFTERIIKHLQKEQGE